MFSFKTLIFSIISDCTFCCFFLHVQEISCTCRKFPECVGNFLAHHADSSYKITKYTIIPAHVGKYSIWLEIFLHNHSDSFVYIHVQEISCMCRKKQQNVQSLLMLKSNVSENMFVLISGIRMYDIAHT